MTEKPQTAYCKSCKAEVALIQKMYCYICEKCRLVLIYR